MKMIPYAITAAMCIACTLPQVNFAAQNKNKDAQDKTIVPIKLEFDQKLEDYPLYSLQAEGLPKNCCALMNIKKINGTIDSHAIYLDDEGMVKCIESTNKLFVLTGGFGYGEPSQIEIIPCQPGCKIIAQQHFVLQPLESIDQAGHKISIEEMETTGNYFKVTLSKFQPNEDVKLISKSYAEVISTTVKTDQKGEATFCSTPAVVGKSEGPFEISVQGKNMQPLVIKHYWGKIAFTPVADYDKLAEKFPKK